MNDLFQFLDIETSSLCRRRCVTCIRNSHPNKFYVMPWMKQTQMPMTLINDIVKQSVDLGYTGSVCLSYFNEPLLDERLSEIIRMVRSYPQLSSVYFHTNGDYMTETWAEKLDGVADRIAVSLYLPDKESKQRADWIQSMFHHTKLDFSLNAKHLTTHYSPNSNLQERISTSFGARCTEVKLHCIINHRRQFCVCCDDLIGNFDMGFFPETSIEEYWFGEKHQTLLGHLDGSNNRQLYPYCSICPR